MIAHRLVRTRPASRCAPDAAASTASAPRVRDDRDTPLCGVGRREFVEMICPTGEAKYFWLAHWTGFSTARPSGKSGPRLCPTRGSHSLISSGAKVAMRRISDATRTSAEVREVPVNRHGPLFDHLVGTCDQGDWNSKPKRFCCFEIDKQVSFLWPAGPAYRQVFRL